MANHFNYPGDYFVSSLGGKDSNTGTSPDSPFKTIGAAITAAQAAGDYKTIVIGTGVYQETLAMGNAYGYHTFQGDGEVYLEGTGNTYALTGYWRQCYLKNMNIINWGLIMPSNEQQEPAYIDCHFKNIGNFNSYRQRYYQPYYQNLVRCTLDNTANWSSELRTGNYQNCLIKNSNTTGNQPWSSYPNANAYAQHFHGCIIDNPGCVAWAGSNLGGTSFDGCVFSAATQVAFYNGSLDLYTSDGSDYMGGGTAYGGFLTYGPSDQDPIGIIDNETGTFNTAHPSHSAAYAVGIAQMFKNCFYVNEIDYNTQLSGSGMFNNIMNTIKFGVSSSIMYKSRTNTAINTLGGTNPSVGYGYESSSANPLHPMGGATWEGITTSSLGGFQIDGSEHSGSITSAVIDQGATKVINNVGIGFTTLAPNAAAPSTHPSGSLNYNPTRYQYEMRYGNASDLSSESYKIFEWGQTPKVNINGVQITGSGDQNFNSGSFFNVSARYLQLKITLRTDMSGSL